PKYCMLQSENQINLFKLGAPPVETILLEDVLATLTSKIAVMKIDVESLECKVGVKTSIGHAGLWIRVYSMGI
ncbi:MAG: hypothetical protein ACK559_18150, partial [bacterium]